MSCHLRNLEVRPTYLTTIYMILKADDAEELKNFSNEVSHRLLCLLSFVPFGIRCTYMHEGP